MKKILSLLFLLVLQAAVFAQWLNPSLENALTGGAFGNEIDDAFNASTGFGEYDQQFIFGGLGNYNATEVDVNDDFKFLTSSATWKSLGKMIFSKDAPAAFGYYFPGKIPFSIYTSLWAEGLPAEKQADPARTLKTWNDDKHSKLDSVAKISSTWMPIFNKYDFKTQFLIGLGEGMSTGLYFNLDGDNSAFDKTSFVKTVYKDNNNSENSYSEELVNFNGTALPDLSDTLAIATKVASNTLPVALNKSSFSHEFTIGVPFAFATGDMSHTTVFQITGNVENSNASFKGKGNDEEIKYNYTAYNSLIDLGLGYTLEMPAADREDDAYVMNAGLEFSFGNSEADGRLTTKKNKIDLKYSKKQKPSLGFKLAADFGRVFNFSSPANAVSFSMTPTAAVELYSGHKAHDDLKYTGYDTETKITFKSNKDKASYSEKNTKSVFKYGNTTEFSMAASCPMGLKILPENWKIGFLLGATPEVKYTVTAEFDRSGNNKTGKKVTKAELNGSNIKDETVDAKYAGTTYTDGATSLEQNVEFSESHFIGLTIPFEGGTHLDIALNGKNLLEFEGFIIQAFIPLGTPKSRK